MSLADAFSPPSDTPLARTSDRGPELKFGTKQHDAIRDKLLDRIKMSENAMSQFYGRWNNSEKRLQAYVKLKDKELLNKQRNDEGRPPALVSVVVPYSFATIATITTYLFATICGRKPLFQVGSYAGNAVNGAEGMETLLQFQADHTKLITSIWRMLQDGEVYGLGALQLSWADEKKKRTTWKSGNGLLMPMKYKVREEKLVYSGNKCRPIDPYQLFPDPRVPIMECNSRGEFFFWRVFEGAHTLQKMKPALINAKEALESSLAINTADGYDPSMRGLLSNSVGGLNNGLIGAQQASVNKFYQIDQGTVELIPNDWDLGTSEEVEKWIFTLVNKSVIIQAEPFDVDHDKHPVAASEPYSMGYDFGQPGLMDYLGPLQDTISWFINSHLENVRTAINNMLVVDPTKVELQDLKNPGPGKIIRLKSAAYGQDVKQALQQLQVVDVTANHMRDLEMFTKFADTLSAVTDNIRGIQNPQGRRSAAEARISADSAASRLAAHARLISGNTITDLTEMLSLNTQQFMDEEMIARILGSDAQEDAIRLSPEHIVGDYYYPVNDGTLPADRTALADIWKEIFLGIAGNPELSQRFDLVKTFETAAELAGAKNIKDFELKGPVGPQFDIQPDSFVQDQAQAGNIVPIDTKRSPIINALGGPSAGRQAMG